MLVLEDVDIRQGEFRLRASLEIEGPGIVAVLGASGAGKSTLLSVIAGFLDPDAGRVLWDGRDLCPLAPGARPVAMIFQDQNLFPHLTVARNVGLGISPGLKLDAREWGRVERTLDRVGLAGLGGRRPAELSGGQVSRAALARVLVQDRPIVLLDEPFAALGPSLRAEMLDLTAEMLSGALVLMITHHPDDARRIAPRSVVVSEGCVTGPFGTDALLSDPPPDLRAYLGP